MQRDQLSNRLAAFEDEAQRIQTRIRDQKRAIASPIARGEDANQAQRRLQELEHIQDAHLVEIERIKQALAVA